MTMMITKMIILIITMTILIILLPQMIIMTIISRKTITKTTALA